MEKAKEKLLVILTYLVEFLIFAGVWLLYLGNLLGSICIVAGIILVALLYPKVKLSFAFPFVKAI